MISAIFTSKKIVAELQVLPGGCTDSPKEIN